ncbi:hypothetical protein FIV36_06160 [Pseudomonas extremaustralis]|uniref:Uncharacterized protein n=1 Tax=Pseudomonas extremaustralis TaxID=359110 RepID=A0A5C5QKW1_9PSED|nr:hypothetical protein FIV36_06160 [Pseudomonas extremaustralis]
MLAKIANDNAVMLEKCGALGFFASKLAPTTAGSWRCLQAWRAAPIVGASLLAKIVNDNAVMLEKCGALGFFASKLAPTTAGSWRCLQAWRAAPLVGASLLAKVVNDNAALQAYRGEREWGLPPQGVQGLKRRHGLAAPLKTKFRSGRLFCVQCATS